MAKPRFTEEQIADFLCQSKNGVSSKALCEKYDFSPSTLRRWQEKHAENVRGELKKIETTASLFFLCFFIVALVFAVSFTKPTGAVVFPPFLIYCIYYIRRFREISAKHIKEKDTFLSRTGRAGGNIFYHLSWAILFLSLFAIGYLIVHL